MRASTGLMILAVLALATVPLFIHAPVKKGEAFTGADDHAGALIATMRPGYTAWFSPLWEPPSGEIASLLFALQAAVGAGVIGFYFGRARGRREARQGVDKPCT